MVHLHMDIIPLKKKSISVNLDSTLSRNNHSADLRLQDRSVKLCYLDKKFIIGRTESSHFDNTQCTQLWKFHQTYISATVIVT